MPHAGGSHPSICPIICSPRRRSTNNPHMKKRSPGRSTNIDYFYRVQDTSYRTNRSELFKYPLSTSARSRAHRPRSEAIPRQQQQWFPILKTTGGGGKYVRRIFVERVGSMKRLECRMDGTREGGVRGQRAGGLSS